MRKNNFRLFMPVIDTEYQDKIGVKLTKNLIKVPIDPQIMELMFHGEDSMTKVWTSESGYLEGMEVGDFCFLSAIFSWHDMLFQFLQNMTKSFTFQCESKDSY